MHISHKRSRDLDNKPTNPLVKSIECGLLAWKFKYLCSLDFISKNCAKIQISDLAGFHLTLFFGQKLNYFPVCNEKWDRWMHQ